MKILRYYVATLRWEQSDCRGNCEILNLLVEVDHSGDSSAVGRGLAGPVRPRPTALLSVTSDAKPEAATAVVVAPDDGHEDARNLLSCI
jgi:hypothetical protein